MLAVRLPIEVENKLANLALETGRTKTFYVREAVLNYIEDLEDYYLAEKEYRDYKAGIGKNYSLAEMEKELGLDA